MAMLIEEISQGKPYDLSRVKGYTEDEIEKLEKLFDIQINGQLKRFLLEMGRCGGGLIGDDPIILYRPNMRLRDFVLLQHGLREEIYETGWQTISRNKPFNFAIEGETQSYFVLTVSDDPDQVYFHDENENTTSKTEWNLVEYLKLAVKHYGGQPTNFAEGDMLRF